MKISFLGKRKILGLFDNLNSEQNSGLVVLNFATVHLNTRRFEFVAEN